MPGTLYRLGVRVLRCAVWIGARVDQKARKRNQGARRALSELAPTPASQTCYWMHCASVGEFEQGRPVWDAIRERHPGARYVLSFFSPSGVEWFAGRADVGEVVYLPWDIGGAPAQFVQRLSPKLAVFVKYEWWLGYHRALRSAHVPVILISAAFRQNQPFFRRRHPLHTDYRNALNAVDKAFVQTKASLELLRRHDYKVSVEVAGDTRLDRTVAIAEETFDDPALSAWSRDKTLIIVAGSTWPTDEQVLAKALTAVPELSLLCAPHEVSAVTRDRIYTAFELSGEVVAYSATTRGGAADKYKGARVMLLDVKGVLAKAYRYGHLAYVGGGFGAGIHNTLEPLVYGLPIAFGPKYRRFDEAIALVAEAVATPCGNAGDLIGFVQKHRFAKVREGVATKARTYVNDNGGATAAIVEYLETEGLI